MNQGGGNTQNNNQTQGNLDLSLLQNMSDQELGGILRGVINLVNGGNSNANSNSGNKPAEIKNEDDNRPAPGFGSKGFRTGNNSTISGPSVSNDENSNISNQLVHFDWNDDKKICCQIPISGKPVTPKAFKKFHDDIEYFRSVDSSPTKSWWDSFGIDCTEHNFKMLGFDTSSLSTAVKKELGWKVHSSPNFAYENKFGIKPYYGPQWDKEGKMMKNWFDGRPKENNGASNGVSNVGIGVRGIPIYPDGGAVMGFGFGGSAITSGPMMYVGY